MKIEFYDRHMFFLRGTNSDKNDETHQSLTSSASRFIFQKNIPMILQSPYTPGDFPCPLTQNQIIRQHLIDELTEGNVFVALV